jgi:hypothetical protein
MAFRDSAQKLSHPTAARLFSLSRSGARRAELYPHCILLPKHTALHCRRYETILSVCIDVKALFTCRLVPPQLALVWYGVPT